MAGRKRPRKPIENRRGRLNYTLADRLEVGMVLTGPEVKAVRAGAVNLAGSYGRLLQGPRALELWLVGARIAGNPESQRSRKLLARRQEINRLVGLTAQKGYTLIPERIYFKGGHAKLLLALGKGRKTGDRREILRSRDLARETERALRAKG